jgi:hypothetical protein
VKELKGPDLSDPFSSSMMTPLKLTAAFTKDRAGH